MIPVSFEAVVAGLALWVAVRLVAGFINIDPEETGRELRQTVDRQVSI